MKIIIPLFRKTFILESQDLGLTETELRLIIGEIEINLKESSVLSSLRLLHDFYAKGEKNLESVYPKMIELGVISESEIEEQKSVSPNVSKFELEDFMNHIEPPFV